jgi:uroporphyrinogen-III synthase
MGFAERAGMAPGITAALKKTVTIARGPKPVQALKELGLNANKIAASPTTEGVLESLKAESLKGKRVGVTLYGEENPKLVSALESAGASVGTVMPYVYAPATDADRIAELILDIDRRVIDAIVFTSSPQVDRLFEVAQLRALLPTLHVGLAKIRVAAVGPVVAETLHQKGVRIDICPEQGFVMKNLVAYIKRAFEK